MSPPAASSPGKVSFSTDTGRPVGMVSMTSRRNAYSPALIWLVGGFWSFSRKAVTRPCASVGTHPNARGSATRCRHSVTSAPASQWVRSIAGRSTPIRLSPLNTSDGVGPQHIGHVADAAAGAQRLAFHDVLEVHPELGAVAEVRLEHLRLVGRAQHDVGDPGGADPADQVGEERHTGRRQHRLRRRQGQRAQPGAHAAHQDHRIDVGHLTSLAQRSDVRDFGPAALARVCRANRNVRFSLVPMSAPNNEPADARPPVVAHRPPRVSHGMRVSVRALCASVSLLVLLASGIAWATFKDFQQTIPHGDAVPADLTDPDGQAQNILLVGNDTRSGATRAELKALHTGPNHGTANADTMMVLHIPSGGGRPTLLSFPRDSWVSIPGYGKGKINAAYPDGYNTAKAHHRGELAAQSAGLIQTIKTIHALTGLHIDHYMQVSLLGFYRISNAIGGVTVCLNAAQNATTDRDEFGHGYSGIDLPKGVSVIKGAQALAFVRQRHGLPHGDLDRVKRQQYFLKAAFEKITSAGILLNPFKMRDLLDAVGQSLLIDPKLNLIALARQFESLTTGKINFETIPNNGAQLIYPDGVETSVVAVNRAAIPAFVKELDGQSDQAYAKARPASPRTVTLDVLNGANIALLATHNAAALRHFGFRTDVVDSTASTPHTVVEYPPGKEDAAKAVVRYVPHATAVATPDVRRVTLVLGTDGYVAKGIPGAAVIRAAEHTSAPTKTAHDPTKGLGCID